MIRLLFPLVLGLAMACGGESPDVGETMGQAASDVAARATEATEATETAVEKAAESVQQEVESATSGVSENCLQLVADGKFKEAVPVCTEALGLEPANAEVKQALDQAKSKAASAAMEGAAKDPAGAASKALR